MAKVLNKMKDFVKAEDVCDDVLAMVEGTPVTRQHKFTVKALYMKAKNMLNLMEFRKAKELLEDQAKPLLKGLGEAFGAAAEEGKDLADSRYGFVYRKKYALYLKKFAFYDEALEALEQILKDEVAFYGLALVDDRLSLQELPALAAEEAHVLKPALLPHMQVRDTFFMMGKIHVLKMNPEKALQALETAMAVEVAAAATAELLYVANCRRVLKEAYVKVYSQRNKQALQHARLAIEISLGIVSRVLGEQNYLHARALLGLGDVLSAEKKPEETEKVYLQAQTVIGNIFSENHPIITEYNANLIEVYSAKADEAERLKTVQVAQKNLDIARQYYGDDSIFVIKHELSLASNKIGAL